MKTLLVILSLMNLNPIEAKASDTLEDEVVCHSVPQANEADTGFTFVLRGNETAWAKVVAVYQNGYAGPRLLANILVPAQPELKGGGHGYIPEVDLVYRGNGITLALQALHIQSLPLTGAGKVSLASPGEEALRLTLACELS